jgi:hypothetical protein
VRAAFTKSGGALGETGSVGFMFDRVGEIIYPPEAGDADTIMEAAIMAGAEDVTSSEDEHVIICAFEDIGEVSTALEEALGEAQSVKAVWKPQTSAPVDEDKAVSVLKLIATLDDDDDVQNVYANFEVSDEVMAKAVCLTGGFDELSRTAGFATGGFFLRSQCFAHGAEEVDRFQPGVDGVDRHGNHDFVGLGGGDELPHLARRGLRTADHGVAQCVLDGDPLPSRTRSRPSCRPALASCRGHCGAC